MLPPTWPPSELLQDPSTEIQWVYNYEEAVQSAVAQRKPLFIDFYADWCIPCRKMDYTTFADESVIRLSKDFIMYKADCSKSSYEGKNRNACTCTKDLVGWHAVVVE